MRPPSTSTVRMHVRHKGEHQPRIELQHVVRDPGSHVDDGAERPPGLVLSDQADELEDVVRAVLGRRELRDGHFDRGASCHG